MPRSFAMQLLALAVFVVFLNRVFGFPTPKATIAKSASSDIAFGTALFIFMVLGMFAQFLYRYFSNPRTKREAFDWGLFIAPLFASPIIFIPLLAAMQNAEVDLTQLTAPRMMIFLVAFQNGFFWKEFFDKRQRELTVHESP